MRQMSLFLFLTFFNSYAFLSHAQASTKDLKLARDYFEAGNYADAKMRYEGLLDPGLDPWKQEVVNYNIATTFLADGKWEEAVFHFQSLVDENIPLPLLEQKVRSNFALARVIELDESLKVLKENLNATNDDYVAVYALFQQVLLDIDKGNTAWCALQEAEGVKSCTSSADLKTMRLHVKSSLNRFLEEYSAYRLSHTSIQDGVLSLLFGEKSLMNQLAVFEKDQFSEKIKDDYLAMYFEQANSWKVLWDNLRAALKSEAKGGDSGKQREEFDSAWQSYVDSLSLAEQGIFQASAAKMEKSRDSLKRLLHQFFKDNSAEVMLQQLLITYGLALFKEPIQNLYLEQILEVQTILGEKLKKSDKLMISDYEKAQNYLKSGIEAFNDFHDTKARIFAEVARFYVKNIFQQMNLTKKMQASTVLENAIDKQEFILLLNRLRNKLQGDVKDSASVDKLFPELQQSTVKTAELFPEAVADEQKAVFSSRNREKSRCQCHPWDEVIPLFSEGYINAEQAERGLQIHAVKQKTIGKLQKKAVDHWKKALAKMRSTSSKTKPSSGQLQNDLKPPPENHASQENQLQNAQLNNILRLVQDMEKDDRSKPAFKTASGNNKGDDRPW